MKLEDFYITLHNQDIKKISFSEEFLKKNSWYKDVEISFKKNI